MNKLTVVASVAIAAQTASIAMADYDVAPSVSSNKIMTNAFTDDTQDFVPNVRVFDFAFGDDPLQPFFIQDPGFHPQPGSGLPPGSAVTVSVLSGLSYWNGTGNPSFGPVPAGETLKLEKGSGSLTVGASAPAGFLTIDASTPATGEFDQHLGSTLMGIAAADPSAGIYLTTFQLHESDASIAASPSIFIVYNNGLDDALVDDAKVCLRDNFAPGTNLAPLPEPASMSLLALGAIPMLRRRRREP
jgi:MYXO-CTERM domain-containing protein